jgi:putative Mn2+ efflux pump MntP
MKIKNIATLIFRIIGAWMIYDGFDDAVAAIAYKQSIMAIADIVVGFIIGICIILFSKKLAGLFCRGLDDDAA